MKLQKNQVAGLLFGVAMGVLFYQMLGVSGIGMGAAFALLGSEMFKEKPKK